ncbi:hypothetical protein D3C76_1147040 [compost metagenome]
MLGKNNLISVLLAWVGIFFIVVGFISGLVLGEDYERIWSITFIYWASGVVSGMFFIGLSEIVEQLDRLNKKMKNEFDVVDEDDLILLND